MGRSLSIDCQSVFEQNASIMFLIEPESGEIVMANPAAAAFYGYPVEQLVGMHASQINTASLDEIALGLKRLQNGERDHLQFKNRLANGEERDVEVYSSPVEADGRNLLFVIVHDITLLKAAQDELASSQAIYRAAFRTSFDAVAITRLSDGMYIDVNEAFLNSMGYSREEVIGRTSVELDIVLHADDRIRLTETISENLGVRNLEAKFRKKNGEVFWALLSASLIEIDSAMYILSVIRNISESKEAEEKFNSLAYFDPLTELPNLRSLINQLNDLQEIAARNFRYQALLVIDLDDFKMLNDGLGHEIGDIWLKEVARRLKACTHSAGNVARLSGDTFAILLAELSPESEEAAAQARALADKILASISESFTIDDHERQSSACIGITVFRELPEGVSAALQRAEIAMFKAKETSRNSIRFFSPELHAAVTARVEMEEALRLAIKQNQLSLHYQPQVEGSRLIGVEALVRWNHPKRGLLPPNEFIPLAEKSGLILPLGRSVLEMACLQIAAWAQHKELADITIAVNISAPQFRQPDFVEQVLAIVNRTGANPQRLDLELTETTMVDDIDDIIEKMTRLKAHGIRFSLDDFGTGYSSLTYLKRMPLDQLKIDRSFVRDIQNDQNSGAIAQTIISLGRAMGFSVIAEGVETIEQLRYLSELGCHSFQGYLYSRPLRLDEFEKMWKSPSGHAAHLIN